METQQIVEEKLLVPLDMYLKAGIHIGTKFRTKYMGQFIYKVRPDGLAVLNVQKIDLRLSVAGKLLARYAPEDIMVAGKRENAWKVLELFSKVTGIKTYSKYQPGALTNSALENFTEAKLLLVVDPWPDKNIIRDAVKMGLPVIALCDTNNTANWIDFVIPCNNKGKKSLGLMFWILAREYLLNRKVIKNEKEMSIKLEKFIEE